MSAKNLSDLTPTATQLYRALESCRNGRPQAIIGNRDLQRLSALSLVRLTIARTELLTRGLIRWTPTESRYELVNLPVVARPVPTTKSHRGAGGFSYSEIRRPISPARGVGGGSGMPESVLVDLLAVLRATEPAARRKAGPFHRAVADALRARRYTVEVEVAVAVGEGEWARGGRVDLLARRFDLDRPVAIECDWHRPNPHSVRKLKTLDSWRVILLRESSRYGAYSTPRGIEAVLGAGPWPAGPVEALAPNSEAQPIPRTEAWAALNTAAATLGIRCSPGSRYGQEVLKKLYARLREGYTIPDLVKATLAAQAAIHRGDVWHGLRNLMYVWGRGFPALLGDAEGGGPATPGVHRTGADLDDWAAGTKAVQAQPLPALD